LKREIRRIDSRFRGNDIKGSGNDIKGSGNDSVGDGNDRRKNGNDPREAMLHGVIIKEDGNDKIKDNDSKIIRFRIRIFESLRY